MATIFWLPSALIVTPPQAITSRSGPADGIIGGACDVGNGDGDCGGGDYGIGGNGGVFGCFDRRPSEVPSSKAYPPLVPTPPKTRPLLTG